MYNLCNVSLVYMVLLTRVTCTASARMEMRLLIFLFKLLLSELLVYEGFLMHLVVKATQRKVFICPDTFTAFEDGAPTLWKCRKLKDFSQELQCAVAVLPTALFACMLMYMQPDLSAMKKIVLF